MRAAPELDLPSLMLSGNDPVVPGAGPAENIVGIAKDMPGGRYPWV